MSGRYQIRVFESLEKDGATASGTELQPVSFTFSLYADSVDHAELILRKEVERGKHARGRVYQICPAAAYGIMRSVAAALDGSFFHVFMDPAAGPFSELRRIRLPKPSSETQPEIPIPAAQS